MIYELYKPYISIIRLLYKAWFRGEQRVRWTIAGSILLVAAAIFVVAVVQPAGLEKELADAIAVGLGVVAAILTFGVIAYQNLLEEEAQKRKIENVEERVREHPEKPQLAWDLARIKLESYLDRNLGQVRSIYWLTLFVMVVGFAFILYGLWHAFQTPDRLPVAIVASASGVIVSFIGGSLLLIYRSILNQSKDYVSVLERINAVGMAVQVISNIPDASGSLRDQATADLAKQLLSLYAAPKTSTTPTENA